MATPIDTVVFAQFAFVAVTSVAALTGIGVAVHAYFARAKRQPVLAPPMDEERLQQLEQAMESIALEVERIAEGQRFLTRLQTETADDRVLGNRSAS